jgi:endonuclease/exonuclease/phosphatase (EEP) superfamily protein YafD
VLVAAALVLALLAVTGAGRSLRSPPIPLTAPITVLPYLYGIVLAVVFAVWAAVPDRRIPPALLVVVLVVAAALWGPSLAGWGETAAGEPVRVVTWNVRRLWGGVDDDDDARACVVDVLEGLAPDVLSLQEVSRRDIGFLQVSLDLECVHTDYLGTGDPTVGGVAVCVRGDRWRLHSGSGARFVPDKEWRYVFAEVAHEDRVFNVLAVHLQPYRLAAGGLEEAAGVSASQGDQSAELLRRVGRFKDPTLLAGDFNSTRDQALHVALRTPLTDAFEAGGRGFGPTIHLMGWLPIRIDYIYASDDFAVQAAEVLSRDCSDHRPVVADLVLRDP